MGILGSLLAFLALQFYVPTVGPKLNPPDVNLSAIRSIECADYSYGTGFVVADGVVVTARHVTVDSDQKPTQCKDAVTGVPLVTYLRDEEHDLALMKPAGPLFVYYPLKYDCQPYKIGTVAFYGHRPESFRQNFANYLGKHTNVTFKGYPSILKVAILDGDAAAGMSGGPGIQDGYVRGIVTGKEWDNEGNPLKVFSTELSNTALCKDQS